MSADPDEPHGLSRFDWERVVRRVELPASVKLCALILATYADTDGTRVRPGISRLALVMSMSEPSAKRAMTALRSAGLIVRTKQGNRHRGDADEYRLTVPADVSSLPLIEPDEDGPGHLRLVESGDHM